MRFRTFRGEILKALLTIILVAGSGAVLLVFFNKFMKRKLNINLTYREIYNADYNRKINILFRMIHVILLLSILITQLKLELLWNRVLWLVLLTFLLLTQIINIVTAYKHDENRNVYKFLIGETVYLVVFVLVLLYVCSWYVDFSDYFSP